MPNCRASSANSSGGLVLRVGSSGPSWGRRLGRSPSRCYDTYVQYSSVSTHVRIHQSCCIVVLGFFFFPGSIDQPINLEGGGGGREFRRTPGRIIRIKRYARCNWYVVTSHKNFPSDQLSQWLFVRSVTCTLKSTVLCIEPCPTAAV